MTNGDVIRKLFNQFRKIEDRDGKTRYCLFDVVQFLVNDGNLWEEWGEIITSDRFLADLNWRLCPVKDWEFDYFINMECVLEQDVYQVIHYLPTQRGLMIRLWLSARENEHVFGSQLFENESLLAVLGLDDQTDTDGPLTLYESAIAAIDRERQQKGLTATQAQLLLNEFHQGLFEGRERLRAERTLSRRRRSMRETERAFLLLGSAYILERE
ncbi:MAG: hypothetical protein AAF633_23085, partial [Chloroflexota bacterium]